MTETRVLVADRCRMDSLLLRYVLDRESIASDTASSGREVMQRVLDGSYQFIFLDLELSDPNGLEICHSIRQIPQSPRPFIVLLTDRGEDLEPETATRAGADQLLYKPIIPSQILEMVRSSCDKAPREEGTLLERGTEPA